MESCLGLFFLFATFSFPVAIIVIVVVVAVVFKRQQVSAWGSFAQEAGLSLDRGGWFRAPTVSGAYGGFNVYLYTYSQGSGKNKTTYTSMIVYLPIDHRSHVRITREGFLSKITKAFGAQDIQLGDPAFDAAYIIKSDTPQFVPHLLTPQVRGALLSGGSGMNVTVSRGRVFYNQTGVQRDQGMLRYVLDTLVMVARTVVDVETPSQPAPPPPPAVNLPPVSVCDNCGADLDWQADRSVGVAKCEYCGKELRFRFGTLALRGR
ncbi:MAG: hypothetical protein JRG91_00630 [Deltaproteobacteria bacterium]|nr:hypothetical protein [Deltaproteobacteria bacterium]